MIKFNNKLSIIIPVYNEKNTIQKLLNKIHKLNYIKKEIIVVDDASYDGSTNILKKNRKKITKLIHHNKNLGKGAAIKSAQKFIKGDTVIIQDADLEYDPKDYYKLLYFINKGFKVIEKVHNGIKIPQTVVNSKGIEFIKKIMDESKES